MPSYYFGRRVYGTYRDDSLIGSLGNDTFYGSYGTDTLVGGAGNDFYYVDRATDLVIETAGGGDDTISSSVSFTLSNEVETLILRGSSQIDGTGNALANTIIGNSAANRLSGGAGNDTITGAGGNDTIDGGDGVDTVVFSRQLSDYAITTTAAGTTVRALAGSDGTNLLTNVETLRFSDRVVDVSTLTQPPANHAPVAQADAVTLLEDGSVTFAPLANDTDADGNTLSLGAILTAPAHGTATVNANGTLTYVPAANYAGSDSLVYRVDDGKGGSAAGTVTIAVSPVNDAPVVAGNYHAVLNEDAAATFSAAAILANVTDVDGDTVVIASILQQPAHAVSVLNADGSLTITPNADFNGSDALMLLVSDGHGGTAQKPVSIAVNPVNDAPVAKADAAATAAGQAVTINVLANDSDVDGDQLSVSGITSIVGGTAVLGADGSVTFAPTAGFSGAGSFRYSVSDGKGGSASAVATVNVAAAPTPPPSDPSHVTGTAGDDVIDLVSRSLSAMTVDGGAGTDTVRLLGDRSWYNFSKDASGNTVLHEVHASGQSTVLTNVEQLQFAYNGSGLFDLNGNSIGTLAPTTPTTPTTETTPTTSTPATDPTPPPPPPPPPADPSHVTGTAGDDVIDLVSRTLSAMTVDGGAGTDTVRLLGERSWYTFSTDASGNTVLHEVHASGQTTVLTNVEQLQFANNGSGLYDLHGNAIGTSTSTTTTTPTTTETTSTTPTTTPTTTPSTPVPTGTVVPNVLQPAAAGDVVGVQLQNLGATSGSGQVVTFGEVFEDGEIAAGSHLMARVGGQLVPVQMDVKATYADGSVKHAVLSVEPTALAANGTVDLMLTTAGAGATGTALKATDVLSHGYNLKVEVDLHDGQGVRVIDASQVLLQGIQSGHIETWMSGPLASEFRVETTVAGDLKAEFDIRLTADGGIKTDVILAREATYVNSSTYMQDVTYDATIRSNGAVVAQYNNLTQHANSTWHDEVWSGARAQVNVVHDVDHLVATGAVPAYDTSLGVSAAALAGLSTGDTSPMGAGTITTNMSQTGGRADIGLLPTWTAQYLLSQDPKAAAAMLANADAAGSIPWHFVDEATSDPVRLDQHPGLWIDPRQAAGSSADALPISYTTGNTGWMPDTAHEPSLTYVPYLVTGSHYYLDELQAQASFNIASQPTIYRTHTGVDFFSQLRAEAWDLRTLGQVAFITPDGDAMKSYFDAALTKELGRLVDTYVTKGAMDGAGQTEGWFKADYPPDAQAPWQQDYMALSLAQLAGQGFTQADTLLQWAENYLAGRFLNADNGYNPFEGAAYYLQVNDPATGGYYDTWAEAYQGTFGTDVRSEISEYPNAAGGYAAGARGALAGLFNVTHSVDALEAFGYVVSQTQNAGMAQDYANNPTFFVAAELPDGSTLAVVDMKVASGTGAFTLTGTGEANLLYGNAGNDVLDGGAGSDVLFGSGGNDTLKGGSGNDYLYGGKGDDRLEGGAGADIFVFDRINAGHDTVADFNLAEDHLAFGTANVANQGLTAAGLIAGATVDGSGNLVLHPGSGTDITLLGIHQGDLHTSHIIFG